MQRSLLIALALASGAALAQNASAPAAAAAPAPAASLPSSPAKKALVAKILKLQQAGIESMARQLVEQPAAQLLQRADVALQRVATDKREPLVRDIQADTRKYIDETTPIVRDRAVALAPQTIGAVLEARLTEDELKQVVAMLESPVNRKFQALAPEMQRSLGAALVADTRASVEPKLRQLEQTVAKRFEAVGPAQPVGPASAVKP